MTLKITATKDGPYMVEGDLAQLQVVDANGAPYDISKMRKVFLCRCGASVNKPFCDGQHSQIGFEAAEAAVREA